VVPFVQQRKTLRLPIKLLVVRCVPSIFTRAKDKNICVVVASEFYTNVKFVRSEGTFRELGAVLTPPHRPLCMTPSPFCRRTPPTLKQHQVSVPLPDALSTLPNSLLLRIHTKI
jgi:hypothetical protein